MARLTFSLDPLNNGIILKSPSEMNIDAILYLIYQFHNLSSITQIWLLIPAAIAWSSRVRVSKCLMRSSEVVLQEMEYYSVLQVLNLL